MFILEYLKKHILNWWKIKQTISLPPLNKPGKYLQFIC